MLLFFRSNVHRMAFFFCSQEIKLLGHGASPVGKKTSQDQSVRRLGGPRGKYLLRLAHSLFRLKIYFTVNNLEHGFYLFIFLLSFFFFPVARMYPFLNDRHNMKDKGLNEAGCDLTRVCLITGPPCHPLSFFSFHLSALEKQCDPAHTHIYTHLPFATPLPLPAFALCPVICPLSTHVSPTLLFSFNHLPSSSPPGSSRPSTHHPLHLIPSLHGFQL